MCVRECMLCITVCVLLFVWVHVKDCYFVRVRMHVCLESREKNQILFFFLSFLAGWRPGR